MVLWSLLLSEVNLAILDLDTSHKKDMCLLSFEDLRSWISNAWICDSRQRLSERSLVVEDTRLFIDRYKRVFSLVSCRILHLWLSRKRESVRFSVVAINNLASSPSTWAMVFSVMIFWSVSDCDNIWSRCLRDLSIQLQELWLELSWMGPAFL